MPEALSRYDKLMKTNDAMTPLSPAAQAVLDAAYEVRPWMVRADSGDIAAAALRAAADEVKALPLSTDYIFWDSGHEVGLTRAVDKLLAIADELEGK